MTTIAYQAIVAMFADGTPLAPETLAEGRDAGIFSTHGPNNGWALTEYGRSLLNGMQPPGDSASCPDEDSYWPPGKAEEQQASQDALNIQMRTQLQFDPPQEGFQIPPVTEIEHSEHYFDRDRNRQHQAEPNASALDVQIGGDHYKTLGHHQPWEVLATWMTPEELRGYMKGTVIAYLAREQQKGGDTDIEKACHTIQLWQQVRKDK